MQTCEQVCIFFIEVFLQKYLGDKLADMTFAHCGCVTILGPEDNKVAGAQIYKPLGVLVREGNILRLVVGLVVGRDILAVAQTYALTATQQNLNIDILVMHLQGLFGCLVEGLVVDKNLSAIHLDNSCGLVEQVVGKDVVKKFLEARVKIHNTVASTKIAE